MFSSTLLKNISFRRPHIIRSFINKRTSNNLSNLLSNTNEAVEAKIVFDTEFLNNYGEYYGLQKKYNIKFNKENYTKFVKLSTKEIEQRCCLLQELGVNELKFDIIYNIEKYMSLPLIEFHKSCDVPTTHDIANNLLQSLGYSTDVIQMSCEASVKDIYEQCKNQLLLDTIGHITTTKKRYISKYRSLKKLKYLIEFLTKELNMSPEIIKSNAAVLDCEINTVTRNLHHLKEIRIGNKSWSEIVAIKPILLIVKWDEVVKLLRSMRMYNISDETIFKFLFVFIMISDVKFNNIMNEILEDELLHFWINHPRFLSIILRFNVVKQRLNKIRHFECVKYCHLQFLLGSDKNFTRFLTSDFHYIFIGNAIKYAIIKEFGKDKFSLVKEIKRHPSWQQVSVYQINHSIQNLKQLFSLKDIEKQIHIILYPWKQIQDTLLIAAKECSMKGLHYTPSQYLALCVYFIEKENHFSGIGVWPKEQIKRSFKEKIEPTIAEDLKNFQNYIDKKFETRDFS
ncbi:transcription termination factor 5, mitochondrial [Prorops nasuta]|uniref:transcription termination factor 5, mitochondrial n=1 Tax=Prorops nasuta TaxID=863751 RepID=UPI0034CD0C3E